MEISRIVFDLVGVGSSVEIEQVDLLTSDMVIFDVKRSSDEAYLGRRFGLSCFLRFFQGEEELDWESIMDSESFLFKGEEVKIEIKTDPLTQAKLEALCTGGV